MDIIAILKNVGGVLATITTLVYVTGYLALRARAFTLGTDPAFALVYEGYVFAGFRFVLLSLIVLVVLSPAIMAINYSAYWVSGRFSGPFFTVAQWLVLVLLALATVASLFAILSVKGVLLLDGYDQPQNPLEQAVLGGQMALPIIAAVMLVTSLSILWLKSQAASSPGEPLTWMLALVVSLQLILAPVIHGSLYADRYVRVLAGAPETVKGFKEPLAIVDRSSDHVTLLGVNAGDQRELVTIKADDLNGIPVNKIVRLSTFLSNDLIHAKAKGEAAMPEVPASKSAAKPDVPAGSKNGSNKPANRRSFFESLIGTLQISFEKIGSLSSAVDSGDIYLVEISPSGVPGKPVKICSGEFSWPILDSKSQAIYALHQGNIIKLDDDGTPREVDRQKRWIKLFGISDEGDILGMVLEDGESVLATRTAGGTIVQEPEPKTEEERGKKSILEQENRAYAGDRALLVDRSTRGGQGFDLFLKQGNEVHNMSDCGADECGQPFLSPDFSRVLFIRKPRYRSD